MKPYPGPPATLGSTASAKVQIVVWCRDCGHRVEPDPSELAQRYGAATSVPEWHRRLVCSQCGGRAVDFVLTGRGGEDHAPSTALRAAERGAIRGAAVTCQPNVANTAKVV